MASTVNTKDAVIRLLRLGLGVEDDAFFSVDDWEEVSLVALQQCIQPIVFDGYAKLSGLKSPVATLPSPIKKQWIVNAYGTENRFVVQKKVACEMAAIFANNQIRTYVLKGLIFSECYPKPNHRYSADMDCFLTSAQGNGADVWELGNALMEQNKYRVSRGYYKNSTFHMPGLMVENHKFLTPFRGNRRLKKLETLLQQMIRSDKGLDIMEGTDLYRPPTVVSALFLIEHSFSHFLHEGLNLRHYTDWMMFRQYHENDIDWPELNRYVNEFGLRPFYDAYTHVGECIMGQRVPASLSIPEKKMMDSIWEGLDLHETLRGIKGKLNLIGNTFRAAWKYRYFSPISMPRALWIQVKGFLFMKNPEL